MQVDINTILEDLKSGKASRTKDSLDKLNALLEARFNAGAKDYSIAAYFGDCDRLFRDNPITSVSRL